MTSSTLADFKPGIDRQRESIRNDQNVVTLGALLNAGVTQPKSGIGYSPWSFQLNPTGNNTTYNPTRTP
jgi:hypothetical protein